ncbi:asparaginase [candidate division WWE3 bacterium CG_4_9_14_3_um_filter_41_6]|uniref:Asparaginase n=1 Tax=candidate division WWE3 bacterium CG_4_10_14_0_2_um_filter_41_14 TaxID=1975072 RepID=A0A2M7TFK9_UNCKA|nr:MAG: asparaginase [candidate division WWE3 bacterium CG_4_10_14_0_2_um_filter_41_14]PJA38246.1 MAG: asparaginase [candidate division WWE3 bacterium CG_4_9_14_3_um_filter_41_6]
MLTFMLNAPGAWKHTNKYLESLISSRWYKSVAKLQSETVKATFEFFQDKGLEYSLLPSTTNSVSSPKGLGSDSKPVKITIDDKETYLIDSAQFYLELATRINKKGAHYIATSFRGEDADQRHLKQFFHSEAEIVGKLDDVMLLCNDYLFKLAKHLLSTSSLEIEEITGTLQHLEKFISTKEIPQIRFSEAYDELKVNEDYVSENNFVKTITPQGEKKLMEIHGGFVWLTHFEHSSVPFYQAFDKKDPQYAKCADFLMGIGETIGCGERHKDRNETIKALELHQVDKAKYDWYLEMKDLSPLQTSGFGMGIERFLLWVLQHNDIRDIQLIPRFDNYSQIL